jgi:polysaccharide export outer membrane protein
MTRLLWAVLAAGLAAPAPTGTGGDSAADYRVGVGDVLQVTLGGADGTSQSCRVQTTGEARLPRVGDVFVSGRSLAEIEQAVDERLQRDGFRGGVAVEVVDYQSQAVTVVGAVDRPGRLPLRGRTRLVAILAEAGGLTQYASGEVVIQRLDGGSLKVRLRAPAVMTVEALREVDVPIESGDLISVSPKRYISVEGEVAHPGLFAIEDEPTLTWAVARAGGVVRTAAHTVIVRRVSPAGVTAEVPVDLKAIEHGEAADYPLQPGDVVTVKHRVF